MSNIVKAVVGKNAGTIKTAPLYQYDYGQILMIEGIELPAAYQVHFSNDPTGDSTTSIGNENGVAIPDTYLASGETVYAWLYLHTGENDGETVQKIEIPVRQRAAITNETPTPQQQSMIDQIIEELNEAVDAAEDSAEDAADSAEDAADSAEDAEAWAAGTRGGEPVESTDPAYHNNAKYYADQEHRYDPDVKIDKVGTATSSNFASFNSTGGLQDSGKKASDFLTQHQDISGKANLTVVAQAFAEATANDAGSFVTYDGKVYLLPEGHTANTTWANTTKTETNLGAQLGALKSALTLIEDDVILTKTFASSEMFNGIYSTATGNKNTSYKFGYSNADKIDIGKNGELVISCQGYYIRAFRFPDDGVAGFNYTVYTADKITVNGTDTLTKVAFIVRKDPNSETNLTDAEMQDIESKLNVKCTRVQNESCDIRKEIKSTNATVANDEEVLYASMPKPESLDMVNGMWSTTTGKRNTQLKQGYSSQKITIGKTGVAVVRCPGYYIRGYYFNDNSHTYDNDYVADKAVLFGTSNYDRIAFILKTTPESSANLTAEQMADMDAKLVVSYSENIETAAIKQAGYVGALSAKIGSPEIYISAAIDGTDNPGTSVSDIYARYDALCSQFPKWIVREEDIGTDAGNIAIRHYTIRTRDPIVGTADEWTYGQGDKVNYWEQTFKYRRVLINAGTHGDEKSGVYGLLFFIEELLGSSEKWARFIKGNFMLDIIPVLNPTGFNNNTRNNANDVNINRDYFRDNKQPETTAITNYIQSIKDDIFCGVDCHAQEGNYGSINCKPSNPAFPIIMRIANQAFGVCADSWVSVASTVGLPSTAYPFAYGCISDTDGCFHHYLSEMGITDYAVTMEVPKRDTQTNIIIISKMMKDLLGNVIQSFLTINRE